MHNNLYVMSVGLNIFKTDANLFGMNQLSRRRFHRKRVVAESKQTELEFGSVR